MKTNLTSLPNLPKDFFDTLPPKSPDSTKKMPIPPVLPTFPKEKYNALTRVGEKDTNYVSRTLLNELKISLGGELLDKLPYEDNGRITFKDLVLSLSKKDARDIDDAKTDGQIIDKQIEILFDVKKEAKKSIQEAQTSNSRNGIAQYIKKRINTFDELANKASFNNRPFNKVENDLKIGEIRSDNIGNTRFATGANILEPRKVSLSFLDSNEKIVNIKEVEIGTKYNTGLEVLSEAINDNYDKLNIEASWSVVSTGSDNIKAGNISNFTINDILVGNVDILEYDNNSNLIEVINSLANKTGVMASTGVRGHLSLTSRDGRGIVVQGEGIEILSLDTQPNSDGSSSNKHSNYGKLTLVKTNSNDIKMVNNEASEYIGFSKDKVSESTINLRALTNSTYNMKEALSIGASPNDNSFVYLQTKDSDSYPSSVMSHQSAIMSDKIFNSSILQLREIKNTLNANKQTPIYQEAKTSKGILVSKDV